MTSAEKPSGTNDASKRTAAKWEEDNELAKAALLSHMQDDLIPLFEDIKMAKEILSALEQKYGGKYDTYVQLLLDKFNGLTMSEYSSVVDHVNHMALIAKDLSVAGNTISDKMQVSTILNSLPPSWDSVVTAINCSGQVLTMDTLPAILALEEERKKRRKRSNLMVAEDSGRPTKKAKGPHDVKGKQFKHGNQFKNKMHFKHGKKKGKKGACFSCGEIGHYKAACPKRQKSNDDADDGPKDDSKEKVLTVSEAMIIEPTNCDWWIDSGATRHVCKSRDAFLKMSAMSLGEHRLFIGNNTYCDVLGVGDCRVMCNGASFILPNVLYAPTIRMKEPRLSVYA